MLFNIFISGKSLPLFGNTQPQSGLQAQIPILSHIYKNLPNQVFSWGTQLCALVWILPLYKASWVPPKYYRDMTAFSKALIYRQKAWFSSGNSHFRISSTSTQLWKICSRKTAPCELHCKRLLSNNIWILLSWVQTVISKIEEKVLSDIYL